ncbi:MAG: hypothetical protein AAF430_02150 [Myxococcota bacterium]
MRGGLRGFAGLLCLAVVGCATPVLDTEAFSWDPGAWFGWEDEESLEDPPPTLLYQPPADLPPPGSVVGTSGQYREIPLRWDPVLRPDVAGYLVESSDAPDGPFLLREILTDRGVLAWVDRGEADRPLGDGIARYYRLRSYAHDGRVAARASEIAVGTTAELPAPPTDLRAYSRQPRSIPLVWEASNDPVVSGYRVERSPRPDGPFQLVTELDGRHNTHLLDTGLGNLRVLYYRVSSRNLGGQTGLPSEVLRAVTKPEPLPPVGLEIVERRLGTIALRWQPNVESDLLLYRLLRWRGEEGPEPVISVGAQTTEALDTEVGAGETVAYALVAVDQDGLESRPSEPVIAESLGYEWLATASAGGVRLQWNPRPAEGFVRARIERSSWPWGEETATTRDSEHLDREVVPGRHYRYVIVLEREDGESAPPSRPVEVTVPEPGAPFVEIPPPASRIPPPDSIPR